MAGKSGNNMTFIKEVYDTIRKIMLNGRIALCARNILDVDREARGFWALMPTSGVYHPIFCYVDQTDDRRHFIRFCIGINYGSNRNLNGLMRDYLITLSPSLDDKYYCITDISDSCVYLTADALIGETFPTEADIEKAIRNLLAISSCLTDDDISSIAERARSIGGQRFCRTELSEDERSRLEIDHTELMKDNIPHSKM